MKIHTLDSLSLDTELANSMFRDRALQFVERHRWELPARSDGLEVDQYDDAAATYCVVEQDNRHRASLRLRPAAAGSMAEQHFPALWDGQENDLADTLEVTRFCAAPALSPIERIDAISDLLLGLCRHCQRSGIERFFGVVFPQAARTIRQAGWAPEFLNKTTDSRGTLILAQWRVDPFTAWTIQERREFREEAYHRRSEPAAMVPEIARAA